MTLTVDQMVQREINCCLSSLVATLAQGYGQSFPTPLKDLEALAEQAFELASPVLDYEEAALQGGWTPYTDEFGVACWRHTDGQTWAGTADDLCHEFDIDPYEWEVYEFWSISQWLAEKLQAEGEKVDADFAGLCVWARPTTGQMIAMDGVMRRIHAKLTTPAVEARR